MYIERERHEPGPLQSLPANPLTGSPTPHVARRALPLVLRPMGQAAPQRARKRG